MGSFDMKKYLIPIIFLILISSGCIYNPYIDIGGEIVNLEIAENPKQRQTGLMFRESLCDSCGMLFVFEEEGTYSFWMKNTLIPLDMIFIDKDMVIVDIMHALPCTEDPCMKYTPTEKVLYVLEVNQNKFSEEIVGKKVKIYSKQINVQ